MLLPGYKGEVWWVRFHYEAETQLINQYRENGVKLNCPKHW